MKLKTKSLSGSTLFQGFDVELKYCISRNSIQITLRPSTLP